MDIYVQSAGEVVDYTWRSTTGAPEPPPALLSMHKLLNEEDAAFALVAGYTAGSWSVEFRNILLPGVRDRVMGRQIVFSICFAGLPSEKDARALALAYLDFRMERRKSGRITGRVCPELAAAYKPTTNGDYDYDMDAARAWAEKTLAAYRPQAAGSDAPEPLDFTVNPAEAHHMGSVRNHLSTFALSAQEGVRMLWVQLYAAADLPADLVVRYTADNEMSAVPIGPQTPAPQMDSPVTRNQMLMAVVILLGLLAVIFLPVVGSKKDDPPKEHIDLGGGRGVVIYRFGPNLRVQVFLQGKPKVIVTTPAALEKTTVQKPRAAVQSSLNIEQ